jgi:hypothetical protein
MNMPCGILRDADEDLFFFAEPLARVQSQAAQISDAQLTPELLFALAIGRQLFAEAGGGAQKPDDQLIRKIFQPFHKSPRRQRITGETKFVTLTWNR